MSSAANLCAAASGTSSRPAIRRRLRQLFYALGGVLLIAGGILLWTEELKERFVAKRWGVVQPGLIYRSGQISDSLIRTMLERHDIRLVIDLTGRKPGNSHQDAELTAAYHLGAEHIRLPMPGDGRGDMEAYADAIELMVESTREGKPVLVHCSAGTQRTGGVIAMYRLLIQNQPPEQICDEMQQYGWDPEGNGKLLVYLNAHADELAERLVKRGVLDRMPEKIARLEP